LSGCTPSATVATNKDQGFTREPHRLAVIEAMGPELGAYTDSFKTSLSQQIKSCGITPEFVYRPATKISDEDQKKVNAFVQQFRPDTVLAIEEEEYERRTVSSHNSGRLLRSDVSKITYDLQLLDVETKKFVWKAQVSLDTHFGLIEIGDAGAELANSVMQKLQQDNIFHSCPATQAH
jgi:hypothetical protein